jgi:hypothetical protein
MVSSSKLNPAVRRWRSCCASSGWGRRCRGNGDGNGDEKGDGILRIRIMLIASLQSCLLRIHLAVTDWE